jgi:hypothetical protein
MISQEPRQEGVCGLDRRYAGKPHLLDQAILERAERALDAALGGRRVGADDVNSA